MPSQRNALGVVARRRRNNARSTLRWCQFGDAVVGTAQLEGMHRLRILALEPDLVAQPARQLGGRVQGRHAGHIVDRGHVDSLRQSVQVNSGPCRGVSSVIHAR